MNKETRNPKILTPSASATTIRYLPKSLGSSEVAPIAAEAAEETANPVPRQAKPIAIPMAR